MMETAGRPGTLLAIASYDKGHAFLRSAKRTGWRVVLITSQSLQGNHGFPTEAIDEVFYMADDRKKWDPQATLRAVSYLARTRTFDRIVPLDDFDLEMAAMLREHLRVPGMGDTTTRYFRDKLAMRVRARSAGLLVPDFVHLLNDNAVAEFTKQVPPPWVVKPRFLAGAIGIKKVDNTAALAEVSDRLADERSFYVLERYIPGDIMHVDSLIFDGKVVFQRASRYGRPPLDVSHSGDIFSSIIIPENEPQAEVLCSLNEQVLAAMKLVRGASHTEFIVGSDGQVYFLETAARVGGAHLADMVEAATGINLWAEWAKIEIAGEGGSYSVPTPRNEYAGIVVTLARQDHPDTSAYRDAEIAWRLDKKYHVGLIVRSPSLSRTKELIASYIERFKVDFHASAPPLERPID